MHDGIPSYTRCQGGTSCTANARQPKWIKYLPNSLKTSAYRLTAGKYLPPQSKDIETSFLPSSWNIGPNMDGGGYGEGIFWLVNPQEYDAVVSYWIAGTAFDSHDNYHLIARSAFGDLYLWSERTGFSLEIASFSSQYAFYKTDFTKEQLNTELQGFILSRKVDTNDFNDLFNPAREKLGRLKHDEMYGFFPALMLGGSDSLQHLQKVSAIDHLVFLAQLTDLQPYPFSEQPD